MLMKNIAYQIFSLVAILCMNLQETKAVEAGMAFGMNNKILETSKTYIFEHLKNTLNQQIGLPDFKVDFMGSNHL